MPSYVDGTRGNKKFCGTFWELIPFLALFKEKIRQIDLVNKKEKKKRKEKEKEKEEIER